MQSLKSRIVLGLIRHRHLFQFKLKRDPFDPSPEGIAAFREMAERGAKMFGRMSDGLVVEPVQIGEMAAEWMFPENGNRRQIILYFHGGIYVCGSPPSHRMHVAKFVRGSGIGALVFDYRLAPEQPFPAALKDALSAYEFLLNRGYKAKDIRFAGDSAGGGLCLATLLAIKELDLPMPLSAVVLSPWTDLKLTGQSYVSNAKRCLSPEGSAQNCSRFYAGDTDPGDPLVSPVYGDLHGLPPLRIYAGGNEILRDDSVAFAEKAKASGVDVKLTVEKGMCHCYPAFSPLFPEAKAAMEEIGLFLKGGLT